MGSCWWVLNQYRPHNMWLTLFINVCLLWLSECSEHESDDPLDWLRNSIPGEPGVDYPILSSVQETSFSCDSLVLGGYYADPEQQCQVYHVCLVDPLQPASLYPVSFICPNGTVFNQQIFVCDWWFNVDCASSADLYSGAVGAFGSNSGDTGYSGDSGAGQCPAPGDKTPEQCQGAVSNCWSPGFTDTDCPSNGLCCFDGCADTCVDGPTPAPVTLPPVTTPAYQPVEAEPEEEETPEVVSESKPAPVSPAGYSYPVPDIPFDLPVPSRPPPDLPTLYEVPF